MKVLTKLTAAALALAVVAPTSAMAHRAWMLPSATVLSGDDSWITVDAAISNDLFYFNHHAMAPDSIEVTAPDGTTVAKENVAQGKFRSTFDVHLTKEGTYRLATSNENVMARYTVDGKRGVWRGPVAKFSKDVLPKNAENVEIRQSSRRVETFVTLGKPSEVKPLGKGLELVSTTHPNDLFSGESATFQVLLDGKPAQGAKVSFVAGGERYRTEPEAMNFTADGEGKLTVTWAEPGAYWVDASYEDGKTSIPEAKLRQAEYIATLEVLPQ